MTGICGWFLAFLFFRCRMYLPVSGILVVCFWSSGCLCSGCFGKTDRGTASYVCSGFPGSISAYKAVGISGKFLKNLKTGDFPAKQKKKVGGHGAEAGYK